MEPVAISYLLVKGYVTSLTNSIQLSLCHSLVRSDQCSADSEYNYHGMIPGTNTGMLPKRTFAYGQEMLNS